MLLESVGETKQFETKGLTYAPTPTTPLAAFFFSFSLSFRHSLPEAWFLSYCMSLGRSTPRSMSLLLPPTYGYAKKANI